MGQSFIVDWSGYNDTHHSFALHIRTTLIIPCFILVITRVSRYTLLSQAGQLGFRGASKSMKKL